MLSAFYYFSTFTRAHTLAEATQLDTVLMAESRLLFQRNWTGKPSEGTISGSYSDYRLVPVK